MEMFTGLNITKKCLDTKEKVKNELWLDNQEAKKRYVLTTTIINHVKTMRELLSDNNLDEEMLDNLIKELQAPIKEI